MRIYNRLLSADEIKRLYELGGTTRVAETITTNPTLETGLVGHWTMDGNDVDWSSTTAEIRDRSGQGNHGDAQGGMTTTSVTPGVMGQGMGFDGFTEYAAFPDDPLDVVNDITVSLWIKPENNMTENEPFSKYDYAKGWLFDLNDVEECGSGESMYFGGRSGASNLWSTSGCVNYVLGEWQHIVGIRNGSIWSIYVNGVLGSSKEGDSGTLASAVSMNIGRSPQGGGQLYYAGSLDDVRIYNRALSADEVKRLYEMGR